MRKSARKKLVEKLDNQLREYVIKRDKSFCQWCGKKVTGSDRHVSHVIPRSRGMRLRWEPYNVKLLCFHCHMNKWHKNPLESAKWFAEKSPERKKYLDAHSHEVAKLSNADLEKKLDRLKTLTKAL